MDIADLYVRSAPNAQRALDLFKDEWSSAFPASYGLVTKPAFAGLFEDPRIAWADATFGGFNEKTILELGPLEAGHSYMCEKLGAKRVVAVEANSRAYLKYLIVKEVFKLKRVEFELGDFNEYLRISSETFDICIASGVLYHCTDPLESLKMMSLKAKKLFLWTHYYDAALIDKKPYLGRYFRKLESFKRDENTFTMARKDYQEALQWKGFCGGTEEYAYWMSRESILSYLRILGFNEIQINFDQPDHPNGPAFAVCASR